MLASQIGKYIFKEVSHIDCEGLPKYFLLVVVKIIHESCCSHLMWNSQINGCIYQIMRLFKTMALEEINHVH